jgi:glycyl-tRNA synthetase beta chain
MHAVAPRLLSEQLEADRAPLLKALPSLTELVNKATAEKITQAVIAVVEDMPDPREPKVEVFKRVLRISAEVRDFMLDRLEVAERQDGARPDIIRAAQIIDADFGKEDDLVRLLARVHALQAFIATPDGANLLAGYKRAANILKKEGFSQPVTPANAGVSGDGAGQEPHETPGSAGGMHFALSYTPEPAEAALAVALDSAEPAAADAVAREDFEGAMSALASLRAPIDAFFDSVIVNDPERDKRLSRLALLDRVRAAVHNVADFSRIDG